HNLVSDEPGFNDSWHSFSTPRRLALSFSSVAIRQPDLEKTILGPPSNIAFVNGKPSAAAEAFARKAGLPISQLQRTKTSKGEYLSAQITQRGLAASEILKNVV